MSEKKSKAKALGLKSSFAVNDEVIMTAFGKGNDAVVEKKIKRPEIIEVTENKTFDVSFSGNERKFDVIGRGNIHTLVDDPLFKNDNIGHDLIGCKDVLEKRYFGKTFNDNIHIQLIYNILDIDKILAVHINNIIYELNNIGGMSSDEDFIGYMSTLNTFDEFKNPEYTNRSKKDKTNIEQSYDRFRRILQNGRLIYFPDIFYNEVKGNDPKSKPKFELKDEEDIYYILGILGDIRQHLMHDGNDLRYSPYRFDNVPGANPKIEEVLKKVYASGTRGIDKDFVKNNSNAKFKLLLDCYGISEDDVEAACNIAKEYYEYSVLKLYKDEDGTVRAHKNMGFSIKKLREQILELSEYDFLRNKKGEKNKYDSYRGKLYQVIDFIIFKYYKEDSSRILEIVNKLRSSLDDENKEKIYAEEAINVAGAIRSKVKNAINSVDKIVDGRINEMKISRNLQKTIEKSIDEIKLSKQATHYFSKIIYLITRFIDGKEINDLLTTLINKFDNIASFISVMEEENIDCSITENYKVLLDSAEISNELRTINSFARMKTVDATVNFMMLRDAADILGTDFSDTELKEHLNLDDEDRKVKTLPNGKPDRNFRNFIINNVIESSRFKYIVRYSTPKQARALANNELVVKFVLTGIPDEQIERYYNVCTGTKVYNINDARRTLAKEIAKLKFADFEKVNNKASAQENIEKAKKQGIVSLYLTVIYLAIKNLIYVNSRYTLAFHCLERDAELLGVDIDNYKQSHLTSHFIEIRQKEIEEKFNSIENPRRRHKANKYNQLKNLGYLKNDIDCASDYVRTQYRNEIDHINALRNADKYIQNCKEFNSYFELYHYLVQASSLDKSKYQFEKDAKFENYEKYREAFEKYGKYNKDFVKALNVQFGYNYPRFKNLTIDFLFDRNNKDKSKENAKKEVAENQATKEETAAKYISQQFIPKETKKVERMKKEIDFEITEILDTGRIIGKIMNSEHIGMISEKQLEKNAHLKDCTPGSVLVVRIDKWLDNKKQFICIPIKKR